MPYYDDPRDKQRSRPPSHLCSGRVQKQSPAGNQFMQTRSEKLRPQKTAPPAVVMRKADGSEIEPPQFTGIATDAATWAFLPHTSGGALQAPVQARSEVQTKAVQKAGPAIPVIVWFGKALTATTVDAFIDYAIATILALPSPGALDNIVNFLVNLVPGLGEAKKVKKAAKLLAVIDKIIDSVKRLKQLHIPGAPSLLKNITREADQLKSALQSVELDKAKEAFGRMLGYVREAQVANRVGEQGGKVLSLGMKKVGSKKLLTDIDVVFQQGDEVIFGQVKAGKAAQFTRGSNRWEEFENQARRTQEAASAYSKENQVSARVRYFVDDISEEATEFLRGLDIDVVFNHQALH